MAAQLSCMTGQAAGLVELVGGLTSGSHVGTESAASAGASMLTDLSQWLLGVAREGG